MNVGVNENKMVYQSIDTKAMSRENKVVKKQLYTPVYADDKRQEVCQTSAMLSVKQSERHLMSPPLTRNFLYHEQQRAMEHNNEANSNDLDLSEVRQNIKVRDIFRSKTFLLTMIHIRAGFLIQFRIVLSYLLFYLRKFFA